jgi:hypothetical protein
VVYQIGFSGITSEGGLAAIHSTKLQCGSPVKPS